MNSQQQPLTHLAPVPLMHCTKADLLAFFAAAVSDMTLEFSDTQVAVGQAYPGKNENSLSAKRWLAEKFNAETGASLVPERISTLDVFTDVAQGRIMARFLYEHLGDEGTPPGRYMGCAILLGQESPCDITIDKR